MRNYLMHLVLAASLFLVLAAAVNWLADPYAIFGAPTIAGVNASKPAILSNHRIFKIVGYVHREMDALILGTSRADLGINPKHPAFLGLRTINLAMAAQPYAESKLIFQFVADRNDLKTAVIGLDFFAANALSSKTDDFSPDNFAEDRKWKLLLAFDTLKASKKTLFAPGNALKKPDEARKNTHQKFDKLKFIDSEKSYMWGGTYLPGPRCEFLFEADNIENGKMRRDKPLEGIRALIAAAHQRGTKLYLFISPSHARQWEVLAELGLWDKWEEWKRRLVKINAEEAIRAQRPPFPLWDFSGYHSITTEALPAPGAKNAQMFGYIESSHYKPIIGDMLLDRMFGLSEPGKPLPDDFGVLMTPETLDAHLHHIRSDRTQYRQNHPKDIAEIAAMSLDVKKMNRCNSHLKSFRHP